MDIKRGDIWYIESGYSVGSEQRAGRPAIVVSNNRNNQYSGTVEVVYLTTQPKRDLPTHVTISSLSRESTALCEQITSVSTERFGSYRGAVTDEEMEDIEEAMMISLGLAPHAAAEPRDETPPPMLETRLAESEARCSELRQMYDSLLSKMLNR